MAHYIKVKVRAGARRVKLSIKAEDAFIVEVREPAENGRANRAALGILALHLGVPANKLWIVKGAHSPSKIIEIREF